MKLKTYETHFQLVKKIKGIALCLAFFCLIFPGHFVYAGPGDGGSGSPDARQRPQGNQAELGVLPPLKTAQSEAKIIQDKPRQDKPSLEKPATPHIPGAARDTKGDIAARKVEVPEVKNQVAEKKKDSVTAKPNREAPLNKTVLSIQTIPIVEKVEKSQEPSLVKVKDPVPKTVAKPEPITDLAFVDELKARDLANPLEQIASRTPTEQPMEEQVVDNQQTNPIERLEERVNSSASGNAETDSLLNRSIQPQEVFNRFTNTSNLETSISQRLTGELNSAFTKLDRIPQTVLRFSPRLINTEMNPKLTASEQLSQKFEAVLSANRLSSQLNNKFERLATISPQTFNIQVQLREVQIIPQLERLSQVSLNAVPSAWELKSYEISPALNGLERMLPEKTVSFKLSDFGALPIEIRPQLSGLSALPSESRLWTVSEQMALEVNIIPDKGLLSSFKIAESLPLSKVVEQPEVYPQFVRLLHGDNGRRMPVIQALELSGIDVQNLLLLQEGARDYSSLIAAEPSLTINPEILLNGESIYLDTEVRETLNTLILQSDPLLRQLIVKSIR